MSKKTETKALPEKINATSEIVALTVAEKGVGTFVRTAMRQFGSFVVMDRSTADARDGFKPVQRRLFWTMHTLGLTPNKAPKKSARIVGDTMGRFHPHSQKSLYDTLVGMVNARYPLVTGQGNWGSETEPAAADRYTEAQLSKLGHALLEEAHTADLVPNYAGDEKEPLVLPLRIPLLLANGSEGIGLAITAAVPPHHLGELLDACCAMVRKPDITVQGLLKHIQGPDFGQGVLLSSEEEVRALYETGEGTLEYRCVYELRQNAKGKGVFVLKSTAPDFDLQKFLDRMATLQKSGHIDDWSDDSNAENGIHVEITYKDVRVLEERVLKAIHTRKKYRFYTVVRDGSDVLSKDTLKFCTLKDLLAEFLKFRRVIEQRRIEHLLDLARRALKRSKALEAAVLKLDAVFAVLKQKGLDTRDALRKAMGRALDLDEEGAEFVLETKTAQLARMQVEDIRANVEKLKAEVAAHKTDLKDLDAVMIRRLQEMKVYAGERGMQVRVDGAAVKGKASAGYVAARANGQVFRGGDEIPDTGRNPFDFIVKTGERAIVVLPNNKAVSFFPAYQSDAKLKGVVGMAKDTDVFVAAIDESGRGVNFKPDTRKGEIQVLKTCKGELVSATGIGPKDSLVCLGKEDEGFVLEGAACKVTRANVLPYGLADAHKKIVRVLRLPPHGVLIHAGKAVTVSKKGTFHYDTEQPVWVAGKKNYAVIDKKKGIFSQEDVLAAAKKGTLTTVVCLD